MVTFLRIMRVSPQGVESAFQADAKAWRVRFSLPAPNYKETMEDQTFEFLRGFFKEMYVGGSYATYKALRSNLEYGDIDIFILEPRRFESWALDIILNAHFDSVEHFDMWQYYKIKNQYKYITCMKDGVQFDLIFLDIEAWQLDDITASDLSKIYYHITYNEKILCLERSARNVLVRLLVDEVCEVDPTQATEQHLEKIKKRCKLLDIRYKTTLS